MNFLAHIYLSQGDDDIMLGNFMADFITNRQVQRFSPAIQRGIRLHRAIDSFTDQHVIVRQGTKRLRKIHGKYAPVVIDILYDNILARNWRRYSDQDLEEFSQATYGTLHARLDEFPDKLQKRIPLMIADDFLTRYRDYGGLERSLSFMDRRTKFASNFAAAAQQLKDEERIFDAEFHAFFPEVMELSTRFLEGGS